MKERTGFSRSKEAQKSRLPKIPSTRERLEAMLLKSAERLDRGEGVDGEEVFKRLRDRIVKARSKS